MSEEPAGKVGADQRAHPRSPIVVREARCIAGMDVFFGYALNISRGGVFIATPKQRAPGAEYEIQFRLPGLDRAFRCKAQVVWVRRFRQESSKPPGFGLKFLDLPAQDAIAIDEWVQKIEGL